MPTSKAKTVSKKRQSKEPPTPSHGEEVGHGMARVFVYGTLKHGHGNHRLLRKCNAKFLGYDTITQRFKMADMVGFPGLFRPQPVSDKDEPQTFYGEVYAVNQEGLDSLDLLEGHPDFYRREKMWTDGQRRAWVYLISPYVTSQIGTVKLVDDGMWNPTEPEVKYWKDVANG